MKTLISKNPDKLYSLLDSAVLSGTRFLSAIMLARLAGADSFAQYILLMTFGVILLSLAQSYFTTPIVHLSGLPLSERKVLLSGSFKRLNRFLLGASVFFFCGGFLSPLFGVNTGIYLPFAISVVLGLSVQHYRAVLQSQFQMLGALKADVVGLCVLISLASLLTLLLESPVEGFWWGLCGCMGVSILLMKLQNSHLTERTDEVVRMEKIEMYQARVCEQGRPMLLGSFANTSSSRLQPFVLAIVASSGVVAAFGAVMTLVGPIRMFSGALNNILRPRIAHFHDQHDSSSVRSLLFRASSLVLTLGVTTAASLSLFGSEVVSLVFGFSIENLSILLPLAVLFATVDTLTSFQMTTLQITRPHGAHEATALRIIAAVVSILSMVPLIFYFGVMGAIFSLLLAELLYIILATYLLLPLVLGSQLPSGKPSLGFHLPFSGI